MTKTRKLVMATNNAGKLREARAIAGDRLEILSLKDIGFDQDIEETADTLEGNALIKVRAIKDACGLDCFADDTGLMVDALGEHRVCIPHDMQATNVILTRTST